MNASGIASTQWEISDITDQGERVVHLHANDCYYAHLSVYYFAARFCSDGAVLDAGSGTGYGSAYLARHGAKSVLGVDMSAKAIAFSRAFFDIPSLEFRMMDLGQISTLTPGSFDFILCSNVLEHLQDVGGFLRACVRLLKPEGRALFVMPPITSPDLREADLRNVYHLNTWSPRQWAHVIGQYFKQVQAYGHYFAKPGYNLNFLNSPEDTRINETDFILQSMPVDNFYDGRSLSATFLASQPLRESELPLPGQGISFVDDSVSRRPPPRPKLLPTWLRMSRTAWTLLRQYGLLFLLAESWRFLQRRIRPGKPKPPETTASQFNSLRPWVTRFVLNDKTYGGHYDAANDSRVESFFQQIPSPRTILELGSLEGGHTLALARRPGVERVVGLEGRPENLRRAEFVKCIFELHTAEFHLCNLESADLARYGRFDAVFCVGLLYHLPRPWELLREIAGVTDSLFLWTHYAATTKATAENNGWQGMLYKEHGLKDKLSGLSSHSFWPNCDALQRMLRQAGFRRVVTLHDEPRHPHGPAITLVAHKA